MFTSEPQISGLFFIPKISTCMGRIPGEVAAPVVTLVVYLQLPLLEATWVRPCVVPRQRDVRCIEQRHGPQEPWMMNTLDLWRKDPEELKGHKFPVEISWRWGKGRITESQVWLNHLCWVIWVRPKPRWMFCNQHRFAPGRESGGLREIHTPQSGKMKDLVELICFLGGPLQHPFFFSPSVIWCSVCVFHWPWNPRDIHNGFCMTVWAFSQDWSERKARDRASRGRRLQHLHLEVHVIASTSVSLTRCYQAVAF